MESGQRNAPGGAATHKARGGLLGLALLAVISLAAWLGPTAGDNPAEANHGVTVGIDTDVTGNTALALGSQIQACRVITVGQVIDVDLYVQGLSDIISFESYIGYDTDFINISKPGASNQGSNLRYMLQQAQPSPPGNNFTNTGEALPDTANPGEYRVGGYDSTVIPGVEDPDPIGHTHKDGVLVRLEISGLGGLGGFTPLTITPHGPSNGLGIFINDSGANKVGDGADSDVYVDNVINGGIVVNNPGQNFTCNDTDGDGVPDTNDNCPLVVNSNQANFDGDASGDLCDTDDDNDGVVDGSEPAAPNCTAAASGQFDPDCDNDNVSDGNLDPDSGGPIVAGPDNCVTTANTNQLNTDGDAMGNVCDPDDDNDGDLDGADNCPVNANANQANMDGDSMGDACDLEDDGDGFDDTAEAWVLTNPLDNCGSHTSGAGGTPIYSQSWPGDLYSAAGGIPNTVNKVTIQDLTSYLAPVRRFNTSPGVPPAQDDPGYHKRWDLTPGPGLFSKHINIQDLTNLIIVSPLMFGGARAFNYSTACVP